MGGGAGGHMGVGGWVGVGEWVGGWGWGGVEGGVGGAFVARWSLSRMEVQTWVSLALIFRHPMWPFGILQDRIVSCGACVRTTRAFLAVP